MLIIYNWLRICIKDSWVCTQAFICPIRATYGDILICLELLFFSQKVLRYKRKRLIDEAKEEQQCSEDYYEI